MSNWAGSAFKSLHKWTFIKNYLFIYWLLFIICHPSHFSSPGITEGNTNGFTELVAISQWELDRDILILFFFFFFFFFLHRGIFDSVSVLSVKLGQEHNRAHGWSCEWAHHCTTFFSETNCPWGPSASEGKRAKYTGVSAPSSGLLVALGPAMSVLTHPGQQAFRRILSPPLCSLSFLAWILDRTVTPIFVTPYAVSGQPSFLWTPFFVSSTNLFMSPTSSSSVMVSLRNFCCSSGLHFLRELTLTKLDTFTTLPKIQHKSWHRKVEHGNSECQIWDRIYVLMSSCKRTLGKGENVFWEGVTHWVLSVLLL